MAIEKESCDEHARCYRARGRPGFTQITTTKIYAENVNLIFDADPGLLSWLNVVVVRRRNGIAKDTQNR
jgi:hypothetical protein